MYTYRCLSPWRSSRPSWAPRVVGVVRRAQAGEGHPSDEAAPPAKHIINRNMNINRCIYVYVYMYM